jgi:predicted transposase YbfD/YdcC
MLNKWMPRNPNRIDYSKNFPEGFESFSVIEDPRAPGKTLHHFGEVLFLCVTGVLCGMNGFAEITHFGKLQLDWFRKWGEYPNGIPTAQTLSNLFALIESELFQQCLITHLKTLHPDIKKQVIAVDGKTLRGSHNGTVSKAVHAVSAWAADSGLTLAQSFVDEKSNEITALPKLLELLDLQDQIITIDAMGAQTNVAQQIVDQGGDYVLALKGNQKTTHDEVQDEIHFALTQLDFRKPDHWSHHLAELDKSHNRITQRAVVSTTSLEGLSPEIKEKWPNLKSIIVVENDTEIISTGKKRGREKRYYISSLKADAQLFHDIIKKHWSIENQCHWVLDVTFKEDYNRTRVKHAPKNLSTLTRIVHNILKSDTSFKGSLPKKRREAAFNISYREELLSLT